MKQQLQKNATNQKDRELKLASRRTQLMTDKEKALRLCKEEERTKRE